MSVLSAASGIWVSIGRCYRILGRGGGITVTVVFSVRKDNDPEYITYSLYRDNGSSDPIDTHDALEQSIAKWEFIVAWLRENPRKILDDRGLKTCGLCMMYYDGYCKGCVVENFTGQPSCYGTAYEEYSRMLGEDKRTGLLPTAKAEVKFLKSLIDTLE